MHPFQATLNLIGINPYIHVPDDILADIFKQAGREKSPIPIRGTLNGTAYRQTLVRYAGAWRLDINTTMLKNSPKRIGEVVELTAQYDPELREVGAPPQFLEALAQHPEAQRVYDSLPASRRLEIARYLANLKTEESLARNTTKAIAFLLGNGRFVGRDKP